MAKLTIEEMRDRLSQILIESNYIMGDLVEDIGLSRSALTKFILGVTKPHTLTVKKLELFFEQGDRVQRTEKRRHRMQAKRKML